MTLQKKTWLYSPSNKAITIAIVALCAIAIAIYAKDLNSLSMIYVSSDEMGYLGTAAYFAGLDWSSMLSKLYYYSYGYPLILAPIFGFATDPATVYKSAILLNIIMSAAIIPLSYFSAQKLFPHANKWLSLACCFCVAMYSANILQITMARNESLLFLLVWVVFLLFLTLKKESCIAIPIALGILCVYAFTVHQRAIALLIAAAIVILLMFIKKQLTLKQFLAFIISVLAMLILHSFLKDFIKESIWQSSATAVHNDFSDIPRKIGKLFTAEGILGFFRVLTGQIFYMGAASFLLYYAGASSLIPRAWNKLRYGVFAKKEGITKDKSTGTDWSILFLVIAAILTFALSALFLITPVRMDHILYGRYNELFMGPVLLYSLLYLFYRRKIGLRMAAIAVAVFVALGLLAKQSIENLPNFSTISAPGMAWLEMFFTNGWQYVLLMPIFVFAIVLALSYIKKARTIGCLTATGIVCAFFIYAGFYPISNTVLPAQETNIASVEPAKSYIQDQGISDVYAYAEGEDAWQMAYLQFALAKQPIKMLNSADEIANLPNGSTIVTTASGIFVEPLIQHADIAASSGRYIVWNKNQDHTKAGAEIPLSLFSTQTGEFLAENSSLHSSGQDGFLMYGPYLTVPEGNYKVIIRYSPLAPASSAGWADISQNGNQIAASDINLSGLSAGEIAEIELDFGLAEQTSPIEIRIYNAGGAPIEVYGVKIFKG